MANQVLATLSQLAATGSWLGLDLVNQAFLTSDRTRNRQEQRARAGIPWHFGVDDPYQWLHSLGWEATVATLAEVALRYGRWPPPAHVSIASSSSSSAESPRTFFIGARRAEHHP